MITQPTVLLFLPTFLCFHQSILHAVSELQCFRIRIRTTDDFCKHKLNSTPSQVTPIHLHVLKSWNFMSASTLIINDAKFRVLLTRGTLFIISDMANIQIHRLTKYFRHVETTSHLRRGISIWSTATVSKKICHKFTQ